MNMQIRAVSRTAATAILLGCALAAGAAAIEARSPAIMINETTSLPKGIYLRSFTADLRRGSVVAILQPAVARPYLARHGVPADMWILKRVAALGGDAACVRGDVLSTPERQAQVLRRDRLGRALPAWRECRVLAPGELLLLGDTPTSFDSRYFGPVRNTAVAGTYRLVLRW
ncbi:MAG TPA: S26 family signal peptidase [Phenylobacterium sp.]|uniref:S26 family signal peptidase n=1 Tax=Phenylobacterium sp. TaxID=1871053 RepID=UPI002F94466F